MSTANPIWNTVPAEYAIPAQAPSLAEAYAYCERLARSHYENFSVASWFLPKRLRQHFFNVYAYCRISDDLGDETGDTAASLQLLDEWEADLNACYSGTPRHPVFVALAGTVREFDIPKQTFADLLTAFRQDQTVTRYETFNDLLGYCRNSANPVGHLVLYLCGYRDAERHKLSDFTCTALQLANFWQDVSVDYAKGRIYLPLESLRKFGVKEDDLANNRNTAAFCEMMRFEVERARDWFRQGQPLIGKVNKELAIDLDLFSRGGLEILNAIEKQGFAVLGRRPSISKPRKLALVARAAGEVVMSTAVQQAQSQFTPTHSQLAMAYSVCSGIARTNARNFYYAFLVLPHPKRNALCAIYAYMRRCDDLSDDASLPLRERRAKLEAWLEAFHRAQAGEPTDDAILLALTDTQRRYQIPAELLDQLAFGTLMDVPESEESANQTSAQE